MTNDIFELNIAKIKPHPGNPRKDLGNLEELVDSIKTNGLMQNLVVMPKDDEYTLLIGHRRLAALKELGFETAPCKIINDISEDRQVAIMLEENIHRADLTIWEQTQGLQLMLDLGCTEDDICEKTGFSKRTVRRRLNIAELNQETLKEKENSFQLTFTDLAELEAIEDLTERDKILAEATDSKDLLWRIKRYVADKAKKDKIEKMVSELSNLGIKAAPEGTQTWSNGWDVVASYDVEDASFNTDGLRTEDDLFYLTTFRGVRVMKKAKAQANKSKEKSPAELEADQKKKTIETHVAEIKVLYKELLEEIRVFVKAVANGDIKAPGDDSDMARLWNIVFQNGFYAGPSTVGKMIDIDWYHLSEEEKAVAKATIQKLPMFVQLMILANESISSKDIVDRTKASYLGTYSEPLCEFVKVISNYGFSFEKEDYQKIINGTHDLYM